MISKSLTVFRIASLLACVIFLSTLVFAQKGAGVYEQIKSFNLNGGKTEVSGLVLKRDRVTMTLTGTIYYTSPVEGKVTGAVFIGQGLFKADLPPSEFEKDNARRLLGVKTESIESDFTSAVFRFTDDSFDILGKGITDGAAPADAQKLATQLDPRILEETGANLSSRLTLSILNREDRGVFFASYDGGSRGRFSYVFDPQTRIPTDFFDINAGEKGLIFKYDQYLTSNDIWLAFPSLEDYQQRSVSYSDANDLVDIIHYDMNIDLRNPKTRLGLKTKVKMQLRKRGARAIPFMIGEDIGEYENKRLKKQMRVKAVRVGTTSLDVIQEDWESAMTVFLPEAGLPEGPFDMELELEGDFLTQPDRQNLEECSYPRSTQAGTRVTDTLTAPPSISPLRTPPSGR